MARACYPDLPASQGTWDARAIRMSLRKVWSAFLHSAKPVVTNPQTSPQPAEKMRYIGSQAGATRPTMPKTRTPRSTLPSEQKRGRFPDPLVRVLFDALLLLRHAPHSFARLPKASRSPYIGNPALSVGLSYLRRNLPAEHDMKQLVKRHIRPSESPRNTLGPAGVRLRMR